ncbi:hypothetical protein [Streptomyces coelicoflavus]
MAIQVLAVAPLATLHRILLAELNAAGELDWSLARVNGSHLRARREEP